MDNNYSPSYYVLENLVAKLESKQTKYILFDACT